MIKFFRKIRQKLLSESKTGKYLKYAIGEILLVMIGILLALQVSNWNEDRKAAKAEAKALKELLVEFKTNHTDFMRVYEIKQNARDSLNSYINFIMDKRIPESKKDFLYRGFARNTWDPNYSILNGLFSSGMIANIKNDSLKNYLSYWQGHVSNYMRLQAPYEERVNKHSEFRGSVPRRRNLLGEYNIHSTEDIKLHSREMVKSIEYQNLLRRLSGNLSVQLGAMNQVLENYNKIIALLDSEIEH